MRLAVIDDHPSQIEGVAAFTATMSTPPSVEGFTTLAAFEAAYEAGARFDLALLDLGIPGHSELSALECFRKRFDEIPVVVLSATNDPEIIWRALRNHNAMGYIPKTSTAEVTRNAIQLVLAGTIYVPPEVFHHPEASSVKLTALYRSAATSVSQATARAQVEAMFTRRQRDVFDLLLKGLPDKAIANALNLSQETVKTHKKAVFAALGVNNRTKVVLAAHRLGITVQYDGEARR